MSCLLIVTVSNENNEDDIRDMPSFAPLSFFLLLILLFVFNSFLFCLQYLFEIESKFRNTPLFAKKNSKLLTIICKELGKLGYKSGNSIVCFVCDPMCQIRKIV